MGVIILVRHAQASFGAAEYDQLTDHGRHQAALLGASLAARGVRPTRLVSGSMRRQRDTLELAAETAGWSLAPSVDPAWNEFDHLDLLDRFRPPAGEESLADYGRRFDRAVAQWADGHPGYTESFDDFTSRVVGAFEASGVGAGETQVVFTSAGVIAAALAHLLGGEGTWQRLNIVCVNSGITKVVSGRRGISLVSFNDHSHLEPDAVTYR